MILRRGTIFFQKSRSHLQILDARSKICNDLEEGYRCFPNFTSHLKILEARSVKYSVSYFLPNPTLGRPSDQRPGDLAIWRPVGMATWRPGDLATWRPGDLATWRLGDLATWRLGDLATWRHWSSGFPLALECYYRSHEMAKTVSRG
jgi:hypothetical protein